MTLKEWLSRHGMTCAAFAVRLGVSSVAVSRYVAGTRLPRPAIMRRIQQVTGGAVTPADFYGAPAPPRPSHEIGTVALRQLRERHGMSQEGLARALGMSLSGYQKKESGERGMSMAFAARVAAVLGEPVTAVVEAAVPAPAPAAPPAVSRVRWHYATDPDATPIVFRVDP